jgi:hypothetical protein
MLSEMLGKVSVSDCAIIVGSARVDVKPIIAVASGVDEGWRSERSCPAGPFVGSMWLGSSLSIAGRKRRIAKTLPANSDVDFQKSIWVGRFQTQHWMWFKCKEYEHERCVEAASRR